jgi:hypothetical protein
MQVGQLYEDQHRTWPNICVLASISIPANWPALFWLDDLFPHRYPLLCADGSPHYSEDLPYNPPVAGLLLLWSICLPTIHSLPFC